LKALSFAALSRRSPVSPLASPSLLPVPSRPRSRRPFLLGLVALVLLLHLGLLGSAGDMGIGTERRSAAAEPMAVRAIEAPEPEAAESAVVAPSPEAAPVSTAALQAPVALAASAASPEKVSARLPRYESQATAVEDAQPAELAPAAAALPVEPTPAPETGPLAAGEPKPAQAEPEAGMMQVALAAAPRTEPTSFLVAGEKAPPLYRTVLPGPALLGYELRRGPFRGAGEIRWRPAGDRYALQFDVRIAGIPLLSQSSEGELGANGLAPVRFIDQRARKSARAANFSRDSGTISFSGSTHRWPLLAGTQDRLSWMIQLGGIVAADPTLATGGRISMVLVSARGEAAVRSVRFAGRENAETASDSVPSLKFVVDGHSAYDGSFEIWLDPARGYLPARAVSRGSSGEADFELLLQRVEQ
jgi:Protein of unknown function (DUF3108)